MDKKDHGRYDWNNDEELTQSQKDDMIYDIMRMSPQHGNLMVDILGYDKCLEIIKQHRPNDKESE